MILHKLLWPYFKEGPDEELRVNRMAPRYHTNLIPLACVPRLRGFECWNCALLIERKL